MPAPIDNRNAIRHGLTTGKLPPGCAYVVRITNAFRDALERAVLALRHEVTLPDAAAINTAARWERHAQLSQRWLRLEAAEMTADQRLSYSREIARASSERDKCVRVLGLQPGAESDPWGVIDGQPLQSHEDGRETPVAESGLPDAPVCSIAPERKQVAQNTDGGGDDG